MFVVNKLTATTMNGFFVDSHGSMLHGEIKDLSCAKDIIVTAINLFTRQFVPFVTNLATLNTHDGGLDAQVAPSVVRIDIPKLTHKNELCSKNTSRNYKSDNCGNDKKK